jgi:hypothetical protein
MKNYFLACIMLLNLLVLVKPTQLVAQTPEVKTKDIVRPFRLGLMVNPSFNWVSSQTRNVAGDGVSMGVGLGLTFNYAFGKNYVFSADLLHSSFGSKILVDSLLSKETSTKFKSVAFNYRYNAFQIPISLKLKSNEIGYITYWGQLGAILSINYQNRLDITPGSMFTDPLDAENRDPNEAKEDFEYNKVTPEASRRYYLSEDNVNTIMVPLFFGAGIEYNLQGSTSLLAGFRYQHSLTNFMKAEDTEANRHAFHVVLGVLF